MFNHLACKLKDEDIKGKGVGSYLWEGTRGGISVIKKHGGPYLSSRNRVLAHYYSPLKRELGSSEKKLIKKDPFDEPRLVSARTYSGMLHVYDTYLLSPTVREMMMQEFIEKKGKVDHPEPSEFMHSVWKYGLHEGGAFEGFLDAFYFDEKIEYEDEDQMVFNGFDAVRWLCYGYGKTSSNETVIKKPTIDKLENLEKIPSCLWKFKNAENIDLSGTGIGDIDNLIGFPKLKTLDVSGSWFDVFQLHERLKCSGVNRLYLWNSLDGGECNALKKLSPNIDIEC